MNPDETARIEAAAAEWAMRRERGFTPDEQDRFFDWLAADPRHAEVFEHHEDAVDGLRTLAQWRPEHGSNPNPDLLMAHRPARKTSFARKSLPVTLAAAASVALGFWLIISGEPTIKRSGPSIVRRILEDGSSVDLNQGAQIRVAYTAQSRSVILAKGEATFTVAKNSQVPFHVTAGEVNVLAIGTAFNVALTPDDVQVLVTEGRVKVTPNRLENASASTTANFLGAGERAVVPLTSASAPIVSTVAPDEISRLLSWRPTLFEFEDTPLAQAVAVFNQCNRVKLVVDDPALAALPIGGSLSSDNVDGFVQVLESSFSIRAERRSDNTIVLRPAR